MVWLQDANILQHVFGDRIHAETIKRFRPLLHFLNDSRALQDADTAAVSTARRSKCGGWCSWLTCGICLLADVDGTDRGT